MIRLVLVFPTMLLIGQSSVVQSQSPISSKGETTEITIPSKAYPAGRHGWVYTPAGYPRSCQGVCNLIVVFDGAMYLGAIPLPEILDSLIAKQRIPPTVAILVDNGGPPGRLEDLANGQRFATFVGTELVPWVRQHYAVTHLADHSIIAGSSAGGLGAAYIALKYSWVVGGVLSQSGAFWRGNEASNDGPYEWLTQQFAKMQKVNARFFLDVGSMETGGALGSAAPSLLVANRHLRDALKAKGYAVEYLEVPGGQHSPESWRLRLPVGIVALAQFADSALLRTDSAEVVVRLDRTSYSANIGYLFVNNAGKPVSQVVCSGPNLPGLEKKVDDRWVQAYSPVYPLCRGPDFVVAKGQSYHGVLAFGAAQPGHNIMPELLVPTIDGIYRLRWIFREGSNPDAEGAGHVEAVSDEFRMVLR